MEREREKILSHTFIMIERLSRGKMKPLEKSGVFLAKNANYFTDLYRVLRFKREYTRLTGHFQTDC